MARRAARFPAGAAPRAALVWAGMLAFLLGAAGCSLWPFGSGSAEAVPRDGARPRSGLAAEADRLLDADRALAARVLEVGAPAAFHAAFDDKGMRLTAPGEPSVGPDAVRASLLAERGRVLSWEPRYAEVFAPGNWGWTWGEWQVHEPGAGGRRLAQGRYLNVWRKQDDGTWKIRADHKGGETGP